jgi:subtilisin family serine protease
MSPVPRSCSRPRRQRRSHRNFLRRSQLAALGLGLLALLAYTLLHSNVSANGNSIVNYSQKSQATFHPATKAHAAPEFVPGEMLVRYRSEAVARREEAAATPLRVIDGQIPLSVERFNGSDIIEGLRLAHVQSDNTLAAIEAMKLNPDVLYAEPNYIVYENATPNDPAYSQMWGLKNTGQADLLTGQLGLAGADIDAELAWNTTTGSSNVVVGVIDTGVDISHPDLAANIWVNPGEIANNGIDDDNNGFIDDVNGWDFAHSYHTVFNGDPSDPDDHGTHVAGTIGARGNNGLGVTGVNWNVRIMPLKFLSGPNGNGSTADAVSAINYAIMMRNRGVNLRVLNNSWGGGGFSQSLLNAIQAANNAGILFVAAAGNDTADNDHVATYPSNYNVPNVISVAASTRFETLSSFSNYGANTVHLAAPGEQVLSTTPHNT